MNMCSQQSFARFSSKLLCTGVFTTSSQYKKAHKKRDKLARRASRAMPGTKTGQRPGSESPFTPIQTSFAFGSFEQHTTGAGTHPDLSRHAVWRSALHDALGCLTAKVVLL